MREVACHELWDQYPGQADFECGGTMTQEPGGDSIYTVEPGENVTVRINAVNTGEFCSAATDGSACTAQSRHPVVYSFDITEPSRSTQNFVFYGSFIKGAPPSAHYELFLKGDKGTTTEYTGPWLQQTDASGSLIILFEVQ
jgi:hypothetical protein